MRRVGRKLRFTGRLDFRAAVRISRVLGEVCPSRGLTLDLSGVTYIDLSALATLLAADRTLRTHSRSLLLLNPSACVCQALRLFGMGAAGPMTVAVIPRS